MNTKQELAKAKILEVLVISIPKHLLAANKFSTQNKLIQ